MVATTTAAKPPVISAAKGGATFAALRRVDSRLRGNDKKKLIVILARRAGIQHFRESAPALAGAKAGILLRVLPSRVLDNRYAIMLNSRPAVENDGIG